MSETKPVRVMLVDDHAVVRSGLSAFLYIHDDLELVGEAGSGEEALEKCKLFKPDVVLMDLIMDGMNGDVATDLIRKECPNIQVIVLTSFKEKELIEGALQAGAIGYLLKDVNADELANAIRAAVAGKPTLAPEAAQVLINAARNPEVKLGVDLTSREKDVLKLMVDGLSNGEIAKTLFISLSTVKFHVSSILSKLQVNSRTEAVSYILKNNLSF